MLLECRSCRTRRSQRTGKGELNRTKWIRRVLGAVAVLFGVATIIAGARVLAGSDPGYTVFRPLLIYNTAMGVAYVAAGVLGRRSSKQAMHAAGVIFILNCLVLGATGYLYAAGGAIAVESIRAMTFRTAVWLVLLFGYVWVRRRDGQLAARSAPGIASNLAHSNQLRPIVQYRGKVLPDEPTSHRNMARPGQGA